MDFVLLLFLPNKLKSLEGICVMCPLWLLHRMTDFYVFSPLSAKRENLTAILSSGMLIKAVDKPVIGPKGHQQLATCITDFLCLYTKFQRSEVKSAGFTNVCSH